MSNKLPPPNMKCPLPTCKGTLVTQSIRIYFDGKEQRVYHTCNENCGMSTMFKVAP